MTIFGQGSANWAISNRNNPRKFGDVTYYLLGQPLSHGGHGSADIHGWTDTNRVVELMRKSGFLVRTILMKNRPEPTWRVYVRRK